MKANIPDSKPWRSGEVVIVPAIEAVRTGASSCVKPRQRAKNASIHANKAIIKMMAPSG